MNFELIYTLGLFGVAALGILIYMIRMRFRGRARFERIDQQGASALLSKEVMHGFYWFMQPLGRALVFFHITANLVSWTSLIFGFLAGACLAFGHFGFGAIFGTVSAVLDSLDGIVARMTGVSSNSGEVLDASIDRYVEFFFLGGLVIYYREIPSLLILTLLALIGSFMVSYSSAKAEALHVSPPKGSMRRPERALYLLAGAAFSPVTIPWLEVVREFPVPIGHPMVVALGLIAVLSNVSAVERLLAISRAIRVRDAELAEIRRRVAETALEAGASEDSAHSVV